MSPKIENSAEIALTAEVVHVLQRIFANYRKIIIRKEFGHGLSGGRVLEVRPVRPNGAPELPTIVKLAPISLIQQEWQAYQQHLQHRLPRISLLMAEPVLLHELGMGGLRYAMSGDGTFEVVSLHDYCRQAETSADRLHTMMNHLFRSMDNIWSHSNICENFHPHSSYDGVLPVNLLVKPSLSAGISVQALTPLNCPLDHLKLGDAVRLDGFVVHKVNAETQTMTLKSPVLAPTAPAYFMRCQLPLTVGDTALTANQLLHTIEGEVLETRSGRLHAEVRRALGDHIDPTALLIPVAERIALPNPLLALPTLLGKPRAVNIAAIHGDFNLENILIEPETGTFSLIDFADAREDHVLHDFLRLETEIITRLIPEILKKHNLSPAPILAYLYWQLHRTTVYPLSESLGPPHAALHKPWVMLNTLRRTVRNYFCTAGDSSEYYQGLVLYLLGALKFKNLNTVAEAPLPKQVALWSATFAYYLLTTPALDSNQPPPLLAELFDQLPLALQETAFQYTLRGAETATLAEGEQRLAALPTARIAPLGALPAASRMPFSRNAFFVGRVRDLKQIAEVFQRAEAVEDVPSRTLIVTGLGGLGKTQLATEFVHRYGRFFAGGVFWLSFADKRAVPAEVAACGGVMGLRPDFYELPLEKQGELVTTEWETPIPRLLIFDNCEDPELLAQWRPRRGGCRVLVTSRREDWTDTPGVQMLSLEVLQRSESIELLHWHRPDADTPLLDAIAQEVGDLPLALHLAGSYLARYRRALDAEHYLAQLRATTLLEHRSLQSGGVSPTGHEQNISRTIAVSFNQLDRGNPIDTLAMAVLAHAACLAPGEPIPLSLLGLILAGPLTSDQKVEAQEDVQARKQSSLVEALARLEQLGLVRLDVEQHMRLHRLVVAFVQATLPEIEAVRPPLELVLCTEAERLNEAGYPAALMVWQQHLRHVANTAFAREDEQAARVCHALAEHFRQIGDYVRARRALERVVEIRRKVWGEEYEITARSLTELGKVSLWQGDLPGAQAYLEQALAIQEKWLGEHPDTAATLNQLGFLLQHQSTYDKARTYHERALVIRHQVFGEEHSSVAESLCNLAYLAYCKKDFAQARLYLERALAIQQSLWGEDHTETARVLTNLSELLQEQGELEKAEVILTQALVIQQKELGDEHPETARILTNLGEIRQVQGDIIKARGYYELALKIFNASHGADYFRTQRVLHNLQSIDFR